MVALACAARVSRLAHQQPENTNGVPRELWISTTPARLTQAPPPPSATAHTIESSPIYKSTETQSRSYSSNASIFRSYCSGQTLLTISVAFTVVKRFAVVADIII